MDTMTRIARLNEAFGNECRTTRMTPLELFQFCQREMMNITSEMVEIDSHSRNADIDEVRDGFCDIIVFAAGALHKLGANPEDDVNNVVDALQTRLIIDQKQLDATIKFYNDQHIVVTVHGEFPAKCVKSAIDQKLGDDHLPKGKFLKNVFYSKPNLAPLRYENDGTIGAPPEPHAAPIARSFIGQQEAPAPAAGGTEGAARLVNEIDRKWNEFVRLQLAQLQRDLNDCTDDQRLAFIEGRVKINMTIVSAAGPRG